MVNMKIGAEKTLWQKYGKLALTLFAGFLIAFAGAQYYGYYQDKRAIKASAAYDNMLSAMQRQDKTEAKNTAQKLITDFPRTPYSSLAGLMLAKLAVEENDVESAKGQLNLVLKRGNGPIQQIAKVRLARIYADQKDFDAALALLNKDRVAEGYKTLFEETKGDIYLLQNNKEKAREAYQAAITAAPAGVPVTRLQLKQADLGVKEAS